MGTAAFLFLAGYGVEKGLGEINLVWYVSFKQVLGVTGTCRFIITSLITSFSKEIKGNHTCIYSTTKHVFGVSKYYSKLVKLKKHLAMSYLSVIKRARIEYMKTSYRRK